MPPPKTPAFWDVLDAFRSPQDAELADLLDQLGDPDLVTVAQSPPEHPRSFGPGLDRKNSRAIPHRLEDCQYTKFRNDDAKDGLWVINGPRRSCTRKQVSQL